MNGGFSVATFDYRRMYNMYIYIYICTICIYIYNMCIYIYTYNIYIYNDMYVHIYI